MNYRPKPFIIQAASEGDVDCFKLLLDYGCQLNETGFICFSPKEKNEVSSNVIGAAAFKGHVDLMKYVMHDFQPSDPNLKRAIIEYAATEK